MIDLTKYIDVEQFYRQYIFQFKKTGDQAVGKCPFHNDGSASFSMNLKTGQSQCFAGCGSYNLVTFFAKVHNMDNDEAFKTLCEEFDVPMESRAPLKKTSKKYTVEDYAEEKHLRVDLLRGIGVKESGDGISIPYCAEDGRTIVRCRIRRAGKQFKWSKGDELCMYGLWRLEKIKKAGYVILVEGESDTQTLIQLGFPALGVPGATTMKPEWAELLDGIDVYVHDEGDGGAEAFKKKVHGCLKRQMLVIKCRDLDPECKDPNELMVKHGDEEARDMLAGAVASAQEYVDDDEIVPSGLSVPSEYVVDKSGVFKIDDDGCDLVTSTPMFFSSVIRCMETGTEKCELTYYIRGKRYSRIFDRDVLLASRTVVAALAPLGANVSSETANNLVKYLSAFDAVNHDDLPLIEATPRLGWAGRSFVPYDGEVTVDDGIDDRKREILSGFQESSGTLEEWAEAMEARRWNKTFRFLLASSFSSPLLQILRSRVFIVYNWASSRGGKTAALKAAMSVWGDPETTVATFNGTQNAIESIAGFYNNMPLAIDERQMRTGKNAQDSLDQLIYTLSSGRGKDRSTRSGGLRSAEHWRNVVMATGEVPISGAASQTGVMTRTIEIEGSPFDYDEDAARSMHEAVRLLYGTAGRRFIEHVKSIDEIEMGTIYERMRREIRDATKGLGSVSSHIDGASCVAMADYLASICVFGYEDADEAWSMASLMASEVLKGLDKDADIDNSERALDVIRDWIASNKDKFNPNDESMFPVQGRLGEKKHGGYAIIGTRLREELERHGFNVKSVVKQLGDRGCFQNAGGSFTQQLSVGGMRTRCYFLRDEKEAAGGSQTYFEMEEAR